MTAPTPATSTAIWPPSGPNTDQKRVLDLFFSLVDLPDPQGAGVRLANEVFTSNGQFIAVTGNFSGSAEISQCRRNAWANTKTRRHEVKKVYECGRLDIIVIGTASVEMLDENEITKRKSHEFVARVLFEIDYKEKKECRIRKYHILASGANGHHEPTLEVEDRSRNGH